MRHFTTLILVLVLTACAGHRTKNHSEETAEDKDRQITGGVSTNLSLQGTKIRDFNLPGVNANGRISLEDVSPKHTVLVFVKPLAGTGQNKKLACPYCRAQLEDFESARTRLLDFKQDEYITPDGDKTSRINGMKALFIFPGSKDEANTFIGQTPFGNIVPEGKRVPRRSYHDQLKTPFLYDKGASLARSLGIDPATPAVVVVNPEGVIEKAFIETSSNRISSKQLMKAYKVPFID